MFILFHKSNAAVQIENTLQDARAKRISFDPAAYLQPFIALMDLGPGRKAFDVVFLPKGLAAGDYFTAGYNQGGEIWEAYR